MRNIHVFVAGYSYNLNNQVLGYKNGVVKVMKDERGSTANKILVTIP